MEKLTLSIDGAVIGRAKRYAAARGTSVSRLVENMLHMVSTKHSDGAEAPAVLARLRGSLKKGSGKIDPVADYRKHLIKKHL
jgi:hypothetical protein